MSDPVIDVRDLRVNAAGHTILALDRLAVNPGEMLAVLGPNGAGKTTLLRTLSGFQRPSAGTVTVLGRAVGLLGGAALARLRRRIGYVPQLLAARAELPLTLREVVAIGRTGIAGLARPLRPDDWRRVDEWIERLGLESLAGRGYGDLSGGEQRKGLIAKAMVQQPDLLLLDEPTANLDLRWRERIVETLETLYARTRVTVVLVCHELEVLPACCRRVVLLEEGRAAAEGRPEDVLTPERVASLYGVRVEVIHRAGRHAAVPLAGEPACS